MPTRSTPIDPNDLAGLAALANDTLLPQINALLAEESLGLFPIHAYTVMDSENPNNAALPQPPYAFDPAATNWIQELNRIRADYFTLLFGQNGSFGGNDDDSPINPGLYQNPAALNSGPWVIAVNDPVTFNVNNPGSLQITGNPAGFFNQACLFSDVEFWYAAVDSPGGLTITGNLDAPLLPDVSDAAGTRTIKFKLLSSVAGAVTISFIISGTPSALTSNLGTATLTGNNAKITTSISADAELDFVVAFDPNGSNFGTDGSDGSVAVHVVFATITGTGDTVNVLHPGSTGRRIKCAVAALPTLLGSSETRAPSYGLATWQLSLPELKGIWVAKTFPTPAVNGFIDQDIPPYINTTDYTFVTHAVSDTIYEIPATADPDNPYQTTLIGPVLASSARQQAGFVLSGSPYGGADGISTLKVSTINQSTQAQPAQWKTLRDTDFVPFELGFNNDSWNASQNQLATKDGAVNSYGGISPGYSGIKIRLCANGSAAQGVELASGEPFRSKAGWAAGSGRKEFVYGQPLPPGLTMYFSLTNEFPDETNYDYKTTTNSFTDGDGGLTMARINEGLALFFSVQNTLGAADIAYDLYVQLDYTRNPPRRYFPPVNTIFEFYEGQWFKYQISECFSYSIDGTPWTSTNIFWGPQPDGSIYEGADGQNYVPTNGHCIYKIRATRAVQSVNGLKVTPTSGDALVVTIGQNKLQWDNSLQFIPFFNADGITPFTITIPANARDSGDVDVFWPVLEGNEIVYQCAEEIRLEAWANWQPKFHFSHYGRNSGFYYPPQPGVPGFDPPVPTAWQYCLSFTNWFFIGDAFYPAAGGGDESNCTHTQFPISVEIYNDLVNSLSLLPSSGGGDGGGDL